MATATLQTQSLADYIPRLDTPFYLEQANASKIDEFLPGYPARYTGERVWVGSEMSLKQDEWMINLSEQDNIHIHEALRHFQGLNVAPGQLSPKTFPLPQELSKRLRNISHDVYNGRGFAILRGLNPETFKDDENVLVFGGVSSYVASRRGFQDLAREVVTAHVYSDDLKPGAKEHNVKPAFTNGRLAFHTDLGDILTLYAKDVSNTAGETMIVSSSQLYNELAAARPDLLQEFAKDWTFYVKQDYNTDRTPLVNNAAGDKLVFQYSRLPTTGFRNTGPNPTLPPVTPERLEAMAMLEDLAWKNAFALPRQPGDIAFINNLCLMHARTAFDLDANGNPLPSKRHLVKLMLQDPELTWDLPKSLGWYREQIYGSNQPDGGRSEKWHLLPETAVWGGDGGYSNG